MKMFIQCIVFAASGLLIPIVYTLITTAPILSISTLRIKTGYRAKSEELQLYLREFVGQPLYGVDLKAVQRAAQRHPWVASALVRRQPPSELEVLIVERRPVALIKQDRLRVVDSLGVLFKTAETEAEFALPVISVSNDVEILNTHLQAQQPGGSILEIQAYGVRQHKVIFANGLEVIIGHKNSLLQWHKLNRVLKTLREKQHTLAFVYLDDTPKRGQIAVRFKKG